MKKRIFDFGMFSDALRRTALIGGILTALMIVSTVITFAAQWLFSGNYDKITAVGFTEINPLVLLIPNLALPLLILNLFGFLNKRSTSDFWHSVPFTRECIFVSFSAAAFAWAGFALLSSTAVSVFLFSLSSKFAIDFVSILLGLISVFVLCLMIGGGFLLAMSLTGTPFNNIVVALMILYLPRILLFALDLMQTNSYLFGPNTLFLDQSVQLNMLFSISMATIFGFTVPDVFASAPTVIYSFVLSLIYLGLALFCFKKRKSEAASSSAVSKTLQAAFRIVISFTICLIPIYIIIDEWHNEQTTMNGETIFGIGVLYFVAIIAYFLYELISTKKAKNMLKAIPSLLGVVILNIVFIFCAHFGYLNNYNYTPTADSTLSIKFAVNDYGDFVSYNYFDAAVSRIAIKDTEIKKLLCDAYDETRSKYEVRDYRADHTVTVGFETSTGYKYRTVMLSNDEFAAVNDHLHSTQEYKDIYNIDKIFDESIFVSATSYYMDGEDLSEDEQGLIIESFRAEIKAMSLDDFRTLTNSFTTLYTEDGAKHGFSLGGITGSKKLGTKAYYYDLSVTNHTPKTYKLMMDLVFEHQTENELQRQTLDLAKSLDINSKDEEKMHYVSVELYNGIKMTEQEYYQVIDKNDLAKMLEILEASVGKVPDAKSRIAVLYAENYTYGDSVYDEYDHKQAIFYIPDDADLTFLLNDNFYDGGLEGEGSEEIKDEYYTGDYSVIEGTEEDNDNDTSSKVSNSSSSVNDSSSSENDTSSQSQSAA